MAKARKKWELGRSIERKESQNFWERERERERERDAWVKRPPSVRAK